MTPEEQLAHLRDGNAWNLAPIHSRVARVPKKKGLLFQLAIPIAAGLVVAAFVTTGVTMLRDSSGPIAFATATPQPTTAHSNTSEPSPTPSATQTIISSPAPSPAATGVSVPNSMDFNLPGTPAITNLSQPVTHTFVGPQTVQLGTRPSSATGITYTFGCLSAGTIRFPDGSSETCTGTELDDRQEASADPYTLKAGVDTFTVSATTGTTWKIQTTWVKSHLRPLGVNASGRTYGSTAYGLHPTLVAADASNGKVGYVYSKDLRARNSDCDPHKTNYAQCEADAEEDTAPVVVYKLDGKTVIGQMNAATPTRSSNGG